MNTSLWFLLIGASAAGGYLIGRSEKRKFKPITRQDLFSDDVMNAPLELSKNLEKVIEQLDKLKKL